MRLTAREVLGTPRITITRIIIGEDGLAAIVFLAFAVAPFFVSGYQIYILPQYMAFGLLAMSLGLIWGFAGIVSFGQAAFFAIGAYIMGLSMKWGWGGEWLNPAYIALAASIVFGAVLAAAVGYFLFSAGVRGAYFVIATLALSIITEQVAVSQSQITGGWNGMFIERISLTVGGWWTVSLAGDVPMYYFALPILIACYIALRWLVRTKFGKVLAGIRENEDRALSLGFQTGLYKTAAFGVSGAVACFAGAIYGTHAQFVAPTLASVLFSTEVLIWVAIGGRNSLLAALLSGIAVSYLSNYLSGIMPQYWQVSLGFMFIGVVAYFRGGIAGALSEFRHRALARRGIA